MPKRLHAQAIRLENWIKNDAIPLWVSRGINPVNGLNYERLLPSGHVDFASNYRMRVQARQAFFFAAAAQRGWCDQGQSIAQRMLSSVRQLASHESGKGYVQLLNTQYQIVDGKQDLYDHAFFLLAYAWVYRVSGDENAIIEADKITSHLDMTLGSTVGGWIEGDYTHSCRRQNPHMHLFEAFLALYDATQNAKWLARAGEIFTLFQAYFFDAEKGVLFEFFEHDWQKCNDARGEIVEPGHLMEWVWLLEQYHLRTGRPVKSYTDALYSRGVAIGFDKSGLLYDAVTYDGSVLDSRKRCWCMTELIKASLVQIRHGNPKAEEIAITAVDNLFTYYLCATTPGSFVDQRGTHNELLVDFAPASSLYHLIIAAMELRDHCN